MSKNTRGVVQVLLLFGAVLIVGILGFIFVSQRKDNTLTSVAKNVSQIFATPTPTPFAFQELTIPYLRNREYESSLGEKKILSENSNYTSYLTSYISDGLKVFGLLTIPKGDPPEAGWPAIVFVHGYIVPKEYRTEVNYNSYVDYLAKSGFVVFKIDLRGHGNSEGEPGGGYYSGDYVVDTLNAHSALQNSGFVNKDKIGLWGHSMAGNIVFRSFVVEDEVPVVVIWSGAGYTYSDLDEFSIQDTSYRAPPPDSEWARKRQELREAWGPFDPESSFWKQVVPTNYLNGVNGAVQLNHAVNDNVVSIEYSRNLVSILDETDIVHELNEYQDGGHNLTGITFTQAMEKTVEFFKKNL